MNVINWVFGLSNRDGNVLGTFFSAFVRLSVLLIHHFVMLVLVTFIPSVKENMIKQRAKNDYKIDYKDIKFKPEYAVDFMLSSHKLRILTKA